MAGWSSCCFVMFSNVSLRPQLYNNISQIHNKTVPHAAWSVQQRIENNLHSRGDAKPCSTHTWSVGGVNGHTQVCFCPQNFEEVCDHNISRTVFCVNSNVFQWTDDEAELHFRLMLENKNSAEKVDRESRHSKLAAVVCMPRLPENTMFCIYITLSHTQIIPLWSPYSYLSRLFPFSGVHV